MILRNPLTGECFDMRASARTSGAFRFRWTLDPGRNGPPEHRHETESESFTLVAGALDVWIDGRAVRLVAGQRVTVPPGTWHRFRHVGHEGSVIDVECDGMLLEDTIVGNAHYFRGRTRPTAAEAIRVIVHDVSIGATYFRSPVVRLGMKAVAAIGRAAGVRPFPIVPAWDVEPQ